MKHRLAIYFVIVSILEKHGYEVIKSLDKRTIYATRYGQPSSGNDIIRILKHEGLIGYLEYIEPEAMSIWRICLV